jgi:hypothetical protein
MLDAILDEAIDLLTTAKDTGWQARPDGSHTRLLKFTTPVSQAHRGHIVLARVYDGAYKVLPGQHTDDLSGDGLLLRVRILPAKRARVSLEEAAAMYNTQLFGVRAPGASARS